MPTSPENTAHLLSRCGYLTTPQLIEDKAQLDLDELVDWVLQENNPADDVAYPTTNDWERWIYLRRWWVMRMASVPSPLHEKVTMFWHGLFATSQWKVGDVTLMERQNRVIRQRAYGDVEALAQAIAIDPAMLVYLDNASSTKYGPNENWAREMMELFLLGVDNGYTQQDVINVARAWTGYGVKWVEGQPLTFEYHDWAHDKGNKTIFGIGPRNWDGPETITEILKGSRATLSSSYIAGRLWGHFAKPKPDSGWASTLGADLRSAQWNTKEYLRTMFQRAEFYADDVKRNMVHQPVDWAALMLRAAGLGSAMPSSMDQRLADMGQGVFEPPSVAGWKYNQVWFNENAVWMKDEIAASIARDSTAAGFLSSILAQDVPTAVQTVLAAFGVVSVSQRTRSAMEAYLTAERAGGGQNQRYGLIRMVALSPELQMA